ncbi:LysR family transcriptional regulator [Bifidobacterium sp. DSM 109957]|uniref:LysR family transcriptional regulator n=2 Tax=Bifidobacterium oedipodis TaxID=2675322 RepID=A0A7Y0EN25_9BIFI|nr:LysR family transcriptional regulator [Bifidobacterium sp. DSM 109957]
MEIKELRYFVTVVQEEGITAAADVLRVSQPTLSRQIKDLEESLGARLFDRGNRGRALELTREGRMLYRRACEIIALADKAEAEITTSETVEGDLHISAAQTCAMCVVAKALTLLCERHPGVTVHLQDAYSDDIIDRLNNGITDFGLLAQPVDMSGFDYLDLSDRDPLGLVVRADHPLAARANVDVAELKGLRAIVPKGSISRNDSLVQSSRLAEGLRVVGTMNLCHNAGYLVREGFGAMLCPKSAANVGEGSGLTFVPVSPEHAVRVSLAWKRNQPLSRQAEAFLTALREVIDGERPNVLAD